VSIYVVLYGEMRQDDSSAYFLSITL